MTLLTQERINSERQQYEDEAKILMQEDVKVAMGMTPGQVRRARARNAAENEADTKWYGSLGADEQNKLDQEEDEHFDSIGGKVLKALGHPTSKGGRYDERQKLNKLKSSGGER